MPHESDSDRRVWPVGEVLYHYSEHLRPPTVGERFALSNGQVVKVLTAKASDGGIEKRKLTVEVVK